MRGRAERKKGFPVLCPDASLDTQQKTERSKTNTHAEGLAAKPLTPEEAAATAMTNTLVTSESWKLT
jgi:hypothetical protein